MSKKVCAFCDMDIESSLVDILINGEKFTLCNKHKRDFEVGILQIHNNQVLIAEDKISSGEKLKLNQSINKNIDVSKIEVYDQIVNEITNYKHAPNKVYKFILLLSILDYLEDTALEVEQYINREIKLEEFVDYYRLYLENKIVRDKAFSDKTNLNIIANAEINKQGALKYNNLFLVNMQLNPIRHMHDSSFLISDDVKTKKINGEIDRSKKYCASYIKLVNNFGISDELFINSIKVGAIYKIRDILNTDEVVTTTSRLRVGQDVYRRKLLAKYECKCAICGESFIPMLIASHAKPWVKCDSIHEKLSEHNGLLLCSNHDKLYDKGYLTIDYTTGNIIINHQVSGFVRKRTPEKINFNIDPLMKKYFKYHKEHIFKGL